MNYCECGEEMFVLVDDTPLCINHFNDWLDLKKKEKDDNSR